MAHYDIPLDLPHAGTIARRIIRLIEQTIDASDEAQAAALVTAEKLDTLLFDTSWQGENPPPRDAARMRDEAAAIGRILVDEIEHAGIGSDRLGQCVRNLFECLELGEEGASISLRAGEDPDSIQRP